MADIRISRIIVLILGKITVAVTVCGWNSDKILIFQSIYHENWLLLQYGKLRPQIFWHFPGGGQSSVDLNIRWRLGSLIVYLWYQLSTFVIVIEWFGM